MKKLLMSVLAVVALTIHADNIVLKNDNFHKQLYGWNTPAYWAGKTARFEENGKFYMLLESETRGTRVYGRSFGYSRQIEYFAGTIIRIQMHAKGDGMFSTGVLSYNFKSGCPTYIVGGKKQLTDTFKTYEFKIVLPSRCRQILPYLMVNGPGKMIVGWYRMESVSERGASISAATPMQIVKSAAQIVPVTFHSTLPGQDIVICRQDGDKMIEKKLKTNVDGSLTYQPEKKGSGMIGIFASAKGVHAKSYIDVQAAVDYDQVDALAKTIKLPSKMNILVIGDSLSDFYRGQNYLDRLFFWLNKYNSGKVTIRNAGIGGDYTMRVEERLHGMRQGANRAYRQNMYDGLFKQPYDLIFIFLGQNDTRSLRSQNFKKPLVSPEQQAKSLSSILNFIRMHSKAKIVLLSPSPSYVKLFEERSAQMAPRQEMVMFGKKELVDRYDSVNRNFCRGSGCDYVDILTLMRKSGDLKSLYGVDGVHLSPEGGRVIASELVKYFSQKYK